MLHVATHDDDFNVLILLTVVTYAHKITHILRKIGFFRKKLRQEFILCDSAFMKTSLRKNR